MAARMAQEPSGTQAAVDFFHRCVQPLRPQAAAVDGMIHPCVMHSAFASTVSNASERLCCGIV